MTPQGADEWKGLINHQLRERERTFFGHAGDLAFPVAARLALISCEHRDFALAVVLAFVVQSLREHAAEKPLQNATIYPRSRRTMETRQHALLPGLSWSLGAPGSEHWRNVQKHLPVFASFG